MWKVVPQASLCSPMKSTVGRLQILGLIIKYCIFIDETNSIQNPMFCFVNYILYKNMDYVAAGKKEWISTCKAGEG